MALRVFRQTRSGDEIMQLAVRLGSAGLSALLVVRPCSSIHSYTGLEHDSDGGPLPAISMAIRTSWRSAEAGGRDRHGHSVS